MVTGDPVTYSADAQLSTGNRELRIDGRRPLSPELVTALRVACDSVEDGNGHGAVIVRVSGAPQDTGDLAIALVSKWERELRRLESLAAGTIAVADGDCGGPALDALLATDYRIMSPSARLLPALAGATWPGMAVYRLSRLAGVGPVRRACLFGVPIDAQAALAMGVADEVAVDLAIALAKAAELASAADGGELAIRRRLMLEASAASFEDALGVHLAACDRTLRRAAARTQ